MAKKYNDEQGSVLATRLRQLIENEKIQTGKTLRDLAADMGISFTVLSDWQCGNKAPRADSLVILAKNFNVSVDYLLGLSNVQTPNEDIRKMSEYTGLSEDALITLHQRVNTLQELPKTARFEKTVLQNAFLIMDDLISSGTFGYVSDALVKVRSCAESEENDEIRAEEWIKKRHTQEFYDWYRKLFDDASDGFYQKHWEDFDSFKKWADNRTELQIKNDLEGKISNLQQFEAVSNSEAHTYRAQRLIQRYAEDLILEGKQAARKKAGDPDGRAKKETK